MSAHIWKQWNGEVDNFALEIDLEGVGHNGPECIVCGLKFCEHCEPKLWESECPGHSGWDS